MQSPCHDQSDLSCDSRPVQPHNSRIIPDQPSSSMSEARPHQAIVPCARCTQPVLRKLGTVHSDALCDECAKIDEVDGDDINKPIAGLRNTSAAAAGGNTSPAAAAGRETFAQSPPADRNVLLAGGAASSSSPSSPLVLGGDDDAAVAATAAGASGRMPPVASAADGAAAEESKGRTALPLHAGSKRPNAALDVDSDTSVSDSDSDSGSGFEHNDRADRVTIPSCGGRPRKPTAGLTEKQIKRREAQRNYSRKYDEDNKAKRLGTQNERRAEERATGTGRYDPKRIAADKAAGVGEYSEEHKAKKRAYAKAYRAAKKQRGE